MFPGISEELSEEYLYSRGDFVFGACDNELPWPGKITKVYQQHSYGIKFIGHKSSAVLQQSSLLKFHEENINKIVMQYNMNDPNRLTKIIKAIELCKSDELKIARRKEKVVNAEKKQSKKAMEEVKKQTKNPQVVIDQEERRITRRQVKKANKKNRQSVKIAETTPKQESKASAIQYLPSNCQNNQQSLKSNKTISKLLCQIQASKSNQSPSSQPEPKQNWSRLCIADESIQNSFLSTVQSQPNPVYDRSQQQRELQEQKTQQEINEQLKLIPYLKYLISYISREVDEPLSREEKLMFGELLQNNRRLYYEKGLLEHMVKFIVAFNSNKNEERKLCVLEYIKVKERLETVVMLREMLGYDEATNQILDSYKQV